MKMPMVKQIDEEKLKEEIQKGKKWVKKQETGQNFEIVECPPFDPWKDWIKDESCYVLVKVYRDIGKIGVAVCNYNNVILKEFRGNSAQEIYFYLLNKTHYITRLDHAAYLGKELVKAEYALKSNTEYIQE